MAVTAAIMCLYLFVFATEMQTPYGGGETLMIVSITSGVLAFVILIAMACITSLQRLTRYLHNPFPTTKIVNHVNYYYLTLYLMMNIYMCSKIFTYSHT